MVSEWLKRKAQAQRDAAKEFLKPAAAPAAAPAANQGGAAAPAAAPLEEGAAGAPPALESAPMAVKAVAGGVIRGKIYKGKSRGAA